MKQYPSNQETVFVGDLNREITIREMTGGYISASQKNAEFDSPRNALKMCGLTDEDIDLIGVSVLNDLYGAIAELTYPNLRAEREKAIDDGTYVEPTKEEVKEAKKN